MWPVGQVDQVKKAFKDRISQHEARESKAQGGPGRNSIWLESRRPGERAARTGGSQEMSAT